MGLKIAETKIYLTRGDSAYITLSITNSKRKPYVLQDGDEVKVQVRDKPNVGKLLIEGNIITEDEIVWHIRPDDTKELKVGTYYWDAQLMTSNGDVFTFIESSPFVVTDEVTMYY